MGYRVEALKEAVVRERLQILRGLLEITSERGPEVIARCPFHPDTVPSLSINIEKGLYHCFSTACGVKGLLVDMFYKLGIEPPPAFQGLFAKPFLQTTQSAVLNQAELYLISRGLPPEFVGGMREKKQFGGVEIDGKVWVVFPVYKGSQALIEGLFLRSCEDNSKRVFGCMKGCFWTVPTYDPEGVTVVVEGILDALAVFCAGFQPIALLSAQNVPTILENLRSELVLCLDNDEPGELAATSLLLKLKRTVTVRKVSWNGFGAKDPVELLQKKGIEELRRLLNSATSGGNWVSAYKKLREYACRDSV